MSGDAVEVAVGYDLSYGQVASTVKKLIPPKRYRPLGFGEVHSYSGAGILPISINPDDNEVLVLVQKLKGADDGMRLFYDFGGPKQGPQELPSVTASRQFAECTYGLFGFQPHRRSGVGAGPAYDNSLVDALFTPSETSESRLALSSASAQSWARERLVQLSGTEDQGQAIQCTHVSSRTCEAVVNGPYICYLMPVHFIGAATLNYAAKLSEGAPRHFSWLPAKCITCFPIAARLSTRSLRSTLERLTPAVVEKALSHLNDAPQTEYPYRKLCGCEFNTAIRTVKLGLQVVPVHRVFRTRADEETHRGKIHEDIGGWSNPPLPRNFNRSSFTDYSWQSLLADARESINASGRLLAEEHRRHAHGNTHTDLQRFGLSKGYVADQANADRSHSPFEVLLAGSRMDVADALRDIVDVSPPGSDAGTPKAPRRPLFSLEECSIPDEGFALSVEATPEHPENLWQSLVYRPLGFGEVHSYSGAGILPISINPDDNEVLVLVQKLKGADDGMRLFYDFGGPKQGPPLFGVARERQVPMSGSPNSLFQPNRRSSVGAGIAYDSTLVDALFTPFETSESRLALSRASAQSWARERLVQLSGTEDQGRAIQCTHVSSRTCEEVTNGPYICYLMPVHFIHASALNYAAKLSGGGSRHFSWLPAKCITCFPIAPRLTSPSAKRARSAFSITCGPRIVFRL
ncbi:hypothetical protein FOZ61_006745 [Perkinsus olseni]|uniref:Uncharacterized protein n=1 Tax=Perkinsus olseni TaxID=32597 RepID=A0A7J6LBN8_PEROL|nr:hypothetical protein FOZ61_006745 [Perkinsus olseni]